MGFGGFKCADVSTLIALPESVRQQFNLDVVPEFRVSYNISPGSNILTIKPDGKAEHMLWGLVPFFAKNKKIWLQLDKCEAGNGCRQAVFSGCI